MPSNTELFVLSIADAMPEGRIAQSLYIAVLLRRLAEFEDGRRAAVAALGEVIVAEGQHRLQQEEAACAAHEASQRLEQIVRGKC